MKLHKKSLLVIIVLTVVGALLIWAFLGGRKELAKEQELEQPVKTPSRVSILDGESVVTLSRNEEIKSGIAVAPLQPVSHQEELKAYGTVMELRDLFDLYNSYVAGKAQVGKATASLDASQREYERLKPLHENNRNVSDKTFQAAEAAWRSNEADAHAAQEALHTINVAVRQRWGAVIAGWLVEKSPVFNRLRQQQDVLIQIVLPQDIPLKSAPQTALVQTTNGNLSSAKLVSPSPRMDPRIQRMSFFYITSTQQGFLPGMNIIAYLPAGSRYQGVVVPAPAVVWRQGKAWVYVQKGTGQFIRSEISTETPVKDGWFVLKGITAGDRIVVRGSQLLMSEEFRSQIQIGD
ncbi:MAG: multidrug transporter [Desulfobacterales bacterium]|nr:multidrug transporter [Desulfobacterales bacterium]